MKLQNLSAGCRAPGYCCIKTDWLTSLLHFYNLWLLMFYNFGLRECRQSSEYFEIIILPIVQYLQFVSSLSLLGQRSDRENPIKTKFVLRPPVISVLILARIKLSFSPSSLVVYKERRAVRGGPAWLADCVTVTTRPPGHTGPRHIWPGQLRQADREVRKSSRDLRGIKYDAVFCGDRAGGNDAIMSLCFMIYLSLPLPPLPSHTFSV